MLSPTLSIKIFSILILLKIFPHHSRYLFFFFLSLWNAMIISFINRSTNHSDTIDPSWGEDLAWSPMTEYLYLLMKWAFLKTFFKKRKIGRRRLRYLWSGVITCYWSPLPRGINNLYRLTALFICIQENIASWLTKLRSLT